MKLFQFSFLLLSICMASKASYAQAIPKKSLAIVKTTTIIKIDGNLNETAWQTAAVAESFTEFQPTPFLPETKGNETKIKLLYSNAGLYMGGYLYENNVDSIAAELTGRDGFGNNDFIALVLDTYQDKLNGFEYFVTPLNEQWDAKVAPNNNGNNEDFAYNSVWQSATKIQKDGWSFEMFIPYSAIRFGNKKIQDWGFNILRSRAKKGLKSTWQPIDPNVNGFLTQEGNLTGFENIKPPLRLQLSPYFSTYYNHDDNAAVGEKKSSTNINGGMDVKYGINQAFTLDMTLIPDFGQVQTDNLILNLSPFEQKFDENRAFFTEGTELFGKGNLFYSRRIGGQPIHFYDAYSQTTSTENVVENPAKSKLVNATKISGRTQKGLGVGFLNAITKPQYAVIENNDKTTRKFETDPLTNYNVFVLNQSLKNNSSVSFVNTSVIRSGKDYDADVAAALFDFNNKKNTWNVGGQVSVSNIFQADVKTIAGYAHSLYFGKTSGKFNFTLYQDLTDNKFNKNDLSYQTNNNSLDHGGYFSYNINKAKNWYNRINFNTNFNYSRLVTGIDVLKRKELMYQGARINFNFNAQTKKLWQLGMNVFNRFNNNDFYEARNYGRVFKNKNRTGAYMYFNSNDAKKYSWSSSVGYNKGGIFKRESLSYNLGGKIRFNSKFSIEQNVEVEKNKNDAGWAYGTYTGNAVNDTIIFSRRTVHTVENLLGLKYNFNNKMGLTLRARHSFAKVNPQQFYLLNINGDAETTNYTRNANQNFNFLSVDMLYNWQFTQGSFISLAWKDVGQNFSRSFEKNYSRNLSKVIGGNQFTSFSLRVIYFLDYATFRSKMKNKA